MTTTSHRTLKTTCLAALIGGLALPVLARTDGAVDDARQAKAQKAAPETTAARYWRAQLGRPAPDFEIADLAGKTFKLSAQRGKIVVLEWFNPDCPIVQEAYKENGSLRGLGNRLDALDDVVWVAINSGAPGLQGHGVERNAKARGELGLAYPILVDEAGWVGTMYGATTTPHMYVVDAQGQLAYVGGHGEAGAKSPVAAAVEDLRAGRAVAAAETKNFGCSVKYPRKAEIGLVAPRFTLTDTQGKEHGLADQLGKVVVLEWFNPDCPIVKNAYKEGATLDGYAKKAMERGVAWFGINSGAPGQQGYGVEHNQRAREAWKLANPVLMDPEGTTGRAYGATTTPHMYVIDARGVLVYMGGHDDGKGHNYIEAALSDVLAGRPVKDAQTRNYGCSVKYARTN